MVTAEYSSPDDFAKGVGEGENTTHTLSPPPPRPPYMAPIGSGTGFQAAALPAKVGGISPLLQLLATYSLQ